jgi:hypothetical protein
VLVTKNARGTPTRSGKRKAGTDFIPGKIPLYAVGLHN